jgi:hypothetical protein
VRWLDLTHLRGWVSRSVLAIATAGLLFGSAVRAADVTDLTQNMPRGYLGEFSWDGDGTIQNVVITLDSVRALNDQNVEAMGCGSYEINRQVTMIKIRMFVRLSDLFVEIMELSPQGSTSFETDGSHRGNLSKDLQSIDTQWTTRDSGQRGTLHLRAASSAVCAPASSL